MKEKFLLSILMLFSCVVLRANPTTTTDFDNQFDLNQTYSIERVQSFNYGTVLYFRLNGRIYQAIEVLSRPNGPCLSSASFCHKCYQQHYDCINSEAALRSK